ncbi:hypothetical protein NXF25_019934 [Crotalus adamanteus]|uniref:Reverse transcriptase domain-containing protein n=1 Tax=Crotalus adamanteus TaxID=8729 RepID=A0AAW1B4J3_CROAD
MKIFESVIDVCLWSIITISPNQCRFVKGHVTTDVIHAVQLLTEKHRKKKSTVHMAFLDLVKTSDWVPYEFIWYSLHSYGILEAYVHWMQQLLYNRATSSAYCATGVTESFYI